MNNRFMFFVQERGGSNLLNRLLSQIGDNELEERALVHGGEKDIRKLPTKEDVKFYPLYQPVAKILTEQQDSLDQRCAYLMYAEDWWGSESPESNIKPIWGPSMLRSWLSPGNWLVFSMLRDGRNQVTSRLIGDYINQNPAILSSHNKAFTPRDEIVNAALSELDKFERLCLSWAMKVRVHLANLEKFSSMYTILKFEDMTSNPQTFLIDLLEKCGLTPNLESAKSVDLNSTSIWGRGKKFHAAEASNSRYKKWNDIHYEICKKVMGEELALLGYIGEGTV